MDKINFTAFNEVMGADIDTLIHFANQEKIKFHPNIKLPKLQQRITDYLKLINDIALVKMSNGNGLVVNVHPNEVANYKLGNFKEI